MSTGSRDLPSEIRRALADRDLQAALPRATDLISEIRDRTVAQTPYFEEARDRARAIKEEAIKRLPDLIETFEASVAASGGRVHHAATAQEAREIIVRIAREADVHSVVKSKSMTSEEVHLNAALELAGIGVRETDLGEYIVQLAQDRPSHIIAPIIHKSVEKVREAFRDGLGLKEVPERPEELTQLARRLLRKEFLGADMGMSGANFLVADTGTVMIVENEGNARMCTQIPRIHVVLAGVEKIVPRLIDLEPFLTLLPRSATGQLQTSYVSFISGPGWSSSPLVVGAERAFHVVLLDNGRLAMRDDELLREALLCVRCGACLNVCTPYKAVGGHVFGGTTYHSGIGNAWEAGVHSLDSAADFNSLCSTCSRCQDVCPIRIDIPWMNAVLRDRIGASRSWGARFFANPARAYRWGRALLPFSNWAQRSRLVRRTLRVVVGLDERRPLPLPCRRTLADRHRAQKGEVASSPTDAYKALAHMDSSSRIVLFADCHTNFVEPWVGEAAIRVLQRAGRQVLLATGPCCGRAALSQGMIQDAARHARELQDLLVAACPEGADLVGLEPSCLSCVRDDHSKLLPGDPDAASNAGQCFEILQWLEARRPELVATTVRSGPRQVVVHGHCQQKTAGWFPSTVGILSRLPGVKVRTTTAQCCGMAGSYGYKAETSPVSIELGNRLDTEVGKLLVRGGGEGVAKGEVLAAGISCRAQLKDVGGRNVRHPVELLDELLSTDGPNRRCADA